MSIDADTLKRAYKRQPVVCIGALATLVILLAFYFRGGLADENAEKIERLGKESSTIDRNVTNSASLETHLKTLREANERISSGVLRHANQADNLKIFYQLESAAGVKLNDEVRLAPVAPAKGATYGRLNVTVNLTGTYSGILDFIARTHKIAPAVRLADLNMTIVPENPDLRISQISFEVLALP
jgi:Tfp pilus assembly protein PilO